MTNIESYIATLYRPCVKFRVFHMTQASSDYGMVLGDPFDDYMGFVIMESAK